MRATSKGQAKLSVIPNCSLGIPNKAEIFFTAIPSITDSKGASYNPQNIIGRSMPVLTYSHSELRTISLDIHLVATGSTAVSAGENALVPGTFDSNARILRAIASLVYPLDEGTNGAPYAPPLVCSFRCGQLLSSNQPLCMVLTKYTVKFDPNLPFDPDTLLPHKFTIGTTWNVVYSSQNLPGQDRIFNTGV